MQGQLPTAALNRYKDNGDDMKEIRHRSASMKHVVSDDFEFFHYRDEETRNFEYKNHDVYEVYFLISGRVTYLVEGRSYAMKPGDILLINNRELHKPVLEPGETYERIILWIKPDFLKKHSIEGCNLTECFERTYRDKENIIRPKAEMLRVIKNSIVMLEETCNSNEFGSHILKNSYLMEIIVYLNRYFLKVQKNNLPSDVKCNEKINSVIKYINENLDRDLSLDSLSSRFYLNKYYLLHEFKKYTGYSIHQYIQQKRLILSKTLLKEGRSVNEVCDECGFGDYSNFIRAFKKAFGVPPKKYSKSQE